MSDRGGGKALSVLVFRVGQLGDTLLSLPAIYAIRQRHPDHRVVLLTERQPLGSGYVSSWDVLGPTAWFDDVVFYTPASSAWKKLSTMLALAGKIRELGPELVYDLAPERTLFQSRRDRFFFQRLAGVKEYRGGGLLLKPTRNVRGSLPRLDPEWKRLLRVIGADSEAGDFRLSIPEAERRCAQELLRHEGLNGTKRLLAVGSGSKMPAKRWAQARFRELGERLLAADPDLYLLVIGGKEESAIGDDLCSAWGPRSRNVAGRLSVYGSAAVLQGCVAYVGNDTGAMHLAAMAGIPCVSLFSARDCPGQWDPYGQGHVILRHEIECAGCLLTVCPINNKCLDLISVDDAERAVRSVIAAR